KRAYCLKTQPATGETYPKSDLFNKADKNIRIFYGDSDNDITAARDVGARGIRILRASNSTYKPLPQAGAFGEEVIVNSEY
ncbi:HAD family acid phosphatase, partial [Escherichia coli]|nr:HAD family acid phosphatase [Escherichia coli]